MAKAADWFRWARQEGFALGAFNAANIETLKAIAGAAKKMASPVMIEASPGETSFFGKAELVAVVRSMEKTYGVPILLNLDHAPSVESCLEAIKLGFDYIHFDGSALSYEENIEGTRRVVTMAHEKGLLVEGEIDHFPGASADLRSKNVEEVSGKMTDPVQAADFVERTGIDTFASFVGNIHGIYANQKRLDLQRLRQIREAVGEKFLSLHGGSGVRGEDLKEAMRIGVVKVNVNAELRVAFRDTLRKVLRESEEVAIYKIMPEVIGAVQKVVEKKIELLGSAGKL